MNTLRELKKRYPDHIFTCGPIYYIDGLGQYHQKRDSFGVMTYVKNLDDEWVRTSFCEVLDDVTRLWGEGKEEI